MKNHFTIMPKKYSLACLKILEQNSYIWRGLDLEFLFTVFDVLKFL